MRRLATLLAAGAMLAATAAVQTASAAPCEDGVGWRHCGAHARLGDLPLEFRLDMTNKPSSVSASAARDAVAAAAAEWERYWPIKTKVGRCNAVCYEGDSSTGFGRDGVNTISWGNLATLPCDGVHPDGLAVACTWFRGSSGAAATQIAEVDIVLSAHQTWRAASVAERISGEVEGLGIRRGTDTWYDVQSLVAHELGHALGLEDIGDTQGAWPKDLVDTPKYTQTMYRWTYPRSTNKQTLDWGDIAGLQRVAHASIAD